MAYSGTVENTWYIYIITNMINGKKYIGLTNSLTKRWNKHKNAKGSSPALHAAIKKYGVDKFDFVNYAIAFGSDSAKFIEKMLIAEYNTQAPHGYNLTAGGDGTLEPTLELRKKLSESHKGKVQSEETKQKRSKSLKKAYAEGRHLGSSKGGWKLSDEAKDKASKRMLGEKNHAYGKKQSADVIEKKRVALTGKKNSSELIEKKRLAQQHRRMLEKAQYQGVIQ